MPPRKLTAQFVEKVPPPSQDRVEYPDKLLPGLVFRVYASGRKTWNDCYRSPTQRNPKTNKPVQRRPRIGIYPVHSLATARQEAAERLRLVASGVDPEDKRDVVPPTTCAAVTAEFMERYSKPRNKDWRETDRIFNHDVLPVWGNHEIGAITRGDVLDLIDGIVDRGASKMANAVLAAVRRLFNWAVERGYIDASPAAGVRAPTRTVQRDRVLTCQADMNCPSYGRFLGRIVTQVLPRTGLIRCSYLQTVEFKSVPRSEPLMRY